MTRAREDFNRLRLLTRQLVRTPFQEGWQFRLDIDKAPRGFNIYVKDITFGPIEIETEALKVGMQTLTFPSGTAPVGLSMTMRDHRDRRIYDWFVKWSGAMVNEDGTVRLPFEYLRKVKRVNLATGKIQDTWIMFPTKMGDITESVDSEGFLEFAVAFTQFRSWGE